MRYQYSESINNIRIIFMRIFVLAILLACVLGQEMLVTKEYTDYLKRHVEWEVMDYEENIFRGWTLEEAKLILSNVVPEESSYLPSVTVPKNLPASIDWSRASCDHGVKNQGQCGSVAYAVTAMLSDRCCFHGHEHGWLSIQEVISCSSVGCSGGWPETVLEYVVKAHGLVPESCFPIKGTVIPCPKTCADGNDWTSSHVCNCVGVKYCKTIDEIKACLQSGPITVSFGACRSFFMYMNGIYKCDCGSNYLGIHTGEVMGYSDTPVCNYRVKNSWGSYWGLKGYFDIACDQCGISGGYPTGNVMCEKLEA